jgi:hypothetical protein
MASNFFEGLKKGLEAVVAYKKGKQALRSENIEIPAPIGRTKSI